MSHIEVNLVAHQARWGFVPAITPSGASPVRIESSTTSWPRVLLRTADDRWLRVHSDRQPLQEAATWLASASTSPLVCVIGGGYGYALDVLADDASSTAKVLWLEPEPALLRECITRRSWTRLIESGRLMMLAGPEFEGKADAWRLVDANAADPAVLVHPVVGKARPEAVAAAELIVTQAVAGARANEEARRQFAGVYLTNTLCNLPVLARAHDVRTLFRQHVGKPGIVVAAGPSLNKNLDELRQIDGWRERAVVVAVDTALKPMLAAGLSPHYVVAVDPAKLNARTLTGLPRDLDVTLVAEASVDPSAFESFAGRTAIFKVSDTHHPWPWLNALGADVGRLRAWGSVLTTAYDLALNLGCDPIVFVGADLAYTNGQPYCRGTFYEEDWAQGVANGMSLEEVWERLLPKARLVTVDDLNGRSIRSSLTLVAFRDWLVTQSAAASVSTINATGSGILAGPGVKHSTLAQAFELLPAAAMEAPGANTLPVSAIADGLLIATAVRDLLQAAIPRPPAPLPDWERFASPRTNVAEILTSLTGAVANHPDVGALCAAALSERKTAITNEAAGWLALGRPPASPEATGTQHWAWRTGAAGDWCLGPTPESQLPQSGVSIFHSLPALHITARRLEHLATLGLPLHARNVLEVGAGIGDLSQFFLDRGCRLRSTDARPEHVAALAQRFPMHPLMTADILNLDPPPEDPDQLFDVVVCYGTLNHVADPAAALAYLSRACLDMLLLEVNVGPGSESDINPRSEDASRPQAALTGHGCRPSRAWVFAQLRDLFRYVYVPTTQPNHYQYPVDWVTPSAFARRAVFIASRRSLDNPLLISELPDRQRRH